jgi:DNA-binding FadR family transcriptional regulator
MTEPVHRALAAARRPLARPQHRHDRGLPEHRRILAAIASGDAAEARAAMSAHLDTVELYLHEYAREAAAHRAGGDGDA